jgi:hypothetical protein
MMWLDDLFRLLREVVTNEQVAHTIRHMSVHAFQHFLQHHAPHLWEVFKENIGEVFQVVIEWLSGAF